jgi:hypothetical protein
VKVAQSQRALACLYPGSSASDYPAVALGPFSASGSPSMTKAVVRAPGRLAVSTSNDNIRMNQGVSLRSGPRSAAESQPNRRADRRSALKRPESVFTKKQGFTLLQYKRLFRPEVQVQANMFCGAYSETLRMARKASWGISTRPTRFMRFLPSFCFSSSLRLREMSPP